jgi:hypothetical protein
VTGIVAIVLAKLSAGDPADHLIDEEAVAIDDALAPDPGLVPDPIATHPAGLDPLTMCRAGAPCEPAQAAVPAPLHAAIAMAGAQLAYDHHPARVGGTERSARFELWRELAWSAHVSYLVDEIDERSPAGMSITAQNDLAFGGHIALPVAIPSWLVGAVHVLSGASTGNGGALYGAIGARLSGFELELGGSSMQLDRDAGVAASLRASHIGHTLDAWLELDAGAVAIAGMRAEHLGGCAGFDLHRPRWSLDLEGRFGDRALSVIDRGEIAEAVAETVHTSGRAVLRVELGTHLHPYVGVAARTATTPNGIDYALVIGFAGLSFSF